MKKLLLVFAALCALPTIAAADEAKEVETTVAYTKGREAGSVLEHAYQVFIDKDARPAVLSSPHAPAEPGTHPRGQVGDESELVEPGG